MFQKPFRVKTQTAMKGSDRKKLRVDIEQQFPSLSSAQVADLIPNKGDMTQAKIITRSEETLVVFCYQKNPVFFESFKKLYPTVYTLWRFPDMLPEFITYLPVIDKMRSGADLMLPGVVVKGEPHPKMFGDLQKDDLCLVRAKGNRAPLVLGKAIKSGEDLFNSAMKGKAVVTLHCYLDQLWEMGDKSNPPEIPDLDDDNDDDAEDDAGAGSEGGDGEESEETCVPLEQLSVKDKESEADTAAAAASDVNGRVTDSVCDAGEEGADAAAAAEEGQDSTDDMDSLLQYCFKCAIKGRISKSDLPLLTSTLLRGHMQPFCVAGKHLDVKKSSYKKFSKFLSEMEAEGFIKLKEVSKGVDAVTEVDRSHPELRGFEVPEVVEEDTGEESEEARFEPPEIQEVMCVTAAVLPIMSTKGFSKGSPMTAAEVREAVTEYIKDNRLQCQSNKEQVLMDPILAELTLKREEGDLSHLSWNEVFARVMDKLQPGCVIRISGKAPMLKKGKMDPVKMNVEQRGSKKKVTTVQNLEAYGIDVRQFAQMLQRKVAGSATVVPSEQKNRGPEVHVQGNQLDFITRTLLETYKIPRKYLHGMAKAPKAKRK